MTINCELLLGNIGEAVFMLDKDGYVSYCNPTVSSITGYLPQELINKHLAILYPSSEDKVKAEFELSVALKQGKLLSEGWKRSKTGKLFWGELMVNPIAAGNKSGGFTCVLRDNTQRKEQELQLREKEERYRLMVEGVRDYAIFMLDPQGYIITWNDGASRIKGYTGNEIIGKHFSIFYTSEDLETNKPGRELVIAAETGKYEEEGWRVKKNGSLFWANIVITALYNEQNVLIGFLKVTRDLSERKENEEALRRSEERNRLLVEQVTDYGIFMLDEKGRVVSWNEGARRINGYSAQEITGKYFSIFYPQEDIFNGKPAHELTVARAEGKYEEEGWRVRKDGSRFWANVVITAVYNNDGTLFGYSKVTRDLTERIESEKALRDSYEKYRSLAHELEITNKELSLANEDLEQFTSIVSHDLQEPIRTLKSFLQLIEINILNKNYDDLQAYSGKAINAANRMKELILNLLHYSQVGKRQIAFAEVDVKELLNQAIQNLKTAIDKSKAQLMIDNSVEQIKGDKTQLLQLFQNLLSNAIKFTDVQQPRVALKCYRVNDYIQCEVADNGIGIAKEDTPKVFEIFKRLNTKKEFPGTGIGLSICKKIVDQHGGRIWLESEVGKGTTFYFTLNEKMMAE